MAGTRGNGGAALSGEAHAFFGLGLAVLIGFVAYVGRGVIIPLIVAGFLCFLIYTLKETIRSGPLVGRFLPNWLCYVFAFAAIGGAFIFIIDIVRDNVETLIEKAPQYEERLKQLTAEALAFLSERNILPPDFVSGVDELRQTGLSMIRPILSEVGSSLSALTGNAVTLFLYTVFMLLERGRIFRKINLLSDDPLQREAVNETISDIGAMVREYITVKTVTNLITATISYIIMRLVGIEFAGFWALLIFLLNYIPIVGAVSAISAPVLLALVQPDGGGVKLALLALTLLVGAEQLMSSVIEPRLIGKSLNLSPLVILVSLGVWGTLWGFAGALLAVPITVTVMIILTQFKATRPIAILLSDNGEIADIKHSPIASAE